MDFVIDHGVLWKVLQEYLVSGLLLLAIPLLYIQREHCVCIVNTKSLLVVGLCQGCPLSTILIVIFMVRVLPHHSPGPWFFAGKWLGVGGELLPQENEFQYPGNSDMKVEPEMDRRFGAVSAALWALHQTVMVKRELSRKAKLLI